MANALTRFGYLCRDLRNSRHLTMGDQAYAFGCEVHYISAVETGRIRPPEGYVKKFSEWLNLDESQSDVLVKRMKFNVYGLRPRSTSNQSSSMRLFRKISKMNPEQIRKFRKKMHSEADDDRGFSGSSKVR